MRDKIVINGKHGFKTAKRPTSKKKVRDNRENSSRERSAEVEGVNPKKVIML
jgi:hypothetical protein